jgi:FixJ family two-component response regulator
MKEKNEVIMSNKNKGHVYIIDDDLEMRNSLARSLGFIGYDVYTYSDPKDFLNINEIYKPAVILLDMRMKNVSGLDFQIQLIDKKISTPIIFISGESDKNEIIQAMKNGAVDFLLKPFDLNTIEKSVSQALQKSKNQAAEIELRNIYIEKYELLTPREKEVCLLLVEGLKIKEISDTLGVTIATLKIHKARVMKKMGTTSTPVLLRMIDAIKDII